MNNFLSSCLLILLLAFPIVSPTLVVLDDHEQDQILQRCAILAEPWGSVGRPCMEAWKPPTWRRASHASRSPSIRSVARPRLETIHPLVAGYVKAASSSTASWHPIVREAYDAIIQSSVQRTSFSIAINQTNSNPCSPHPPMFTTTHQLFNIINHVVTKVSPEFTDPDKDGLLSCPLNVVFDYMMWTPEGIKIFRNEFVNSQLNRILNVWAGFLDGSDSREFLTSQAPHGWYSADAQPWVNMSEYILELPDDSHKYSSWNSFFTRKFKPGMRPVESPDDSKIITSGCESSSLAIVASGVKLQDRFWLKRQPYSLNDILTSDDELAGCNTTALAALFEGGSLYQASLSPTSYHGWHSPIDGTIEYLYTVPGGIGTYYSDLLRTCVDNAELDMSQGYLTAVAVRMVFIIKADDSHIGRVAMVQVGMAEVSSVEALVSRGDKVKKGDLIGQFKFGGSMFLNIFQPGVIKEFTVSETKDVRLNTPIAITN